MQIRRTELADAPAITEIYNAGSAASPATNLVTWQDSVEERREWIEQMDKDGYPIFVAEEDGKILGWAAYFQFVTPGLYYGTAEDSIYIDAAAQGKGVGSALMEKIVEHAADNDYVHTIITYIVDTNAASIALHEKFGFVETGRMPNIHTKHGQRLGLVHLQLNFER